MRRVQRGAFLAPILSGALREMEDRRERGLLTDLAYGTARWHLYLEACLAPRLKAPEDLPEDVLHILRLGAYEILIRQTPRHAALNEWVEIAKRSSRRLAGLVNAVLRRVEEPAGMPWHLRHALPEWLADELRITFGERAQEAATGMLQPEPLWLTLHGDDARELLARDECTVEEGALEGSVAVRCPKPLARTAAFREGAVQPQNPASLLPALALSPQRGERALDLAAGNGIKSAQLASMGASVRAVEIDPRKVERSERNLRRLGLEVNHLVADLRHPPADLDPAGSVLLDAPCSGTGTLRGNPEIKLRLQAEDIDSLALLQSQLLDTAATLTAPGGKLVYAVCSVMPAEGGRQADRFLARHPEFSAVEWSAPLPAVRSGPGLVTVPAHGIDGFFVAVFSRSR